MSETVYTIGHSTRPLDEFLGLLRDNGVRTLVDIRTVPRSRHNPQFNRELLPDALGREGIGYTHMAGLGGLRRARPDSFNMAWRNASFRGFADYMQTDGFRHSLAELTTLAGTQTVCLMCAEAVPWRCHRSLIGDALTARGIAVKDILGHNQVRDHALTPWAKVRDGQVSYPSLV